MTRTAFRTTSAEGLDRASFPMRLYAKANALAWDPARIDFARDIEDWGRMSEIEQVSLLWLTSLFQAGEESVTVELLPLVDAIAAEGRLEDELFLTAWLFEEGKHTDFFRRFLDEVCGADFDLHHFHTPSYRRIVYEELPSAMGALREDRSPVAQARAVATYTMVVEGVLAETGYHSYVEALERRGLLPGLREGLVLLRRDETRHIAYGTYLLARLAAENDEVWPAIEARMDELLEPAIGAVVESFSEYEVSPFGLHVGDFAEYAAAQFRGRLARIERARATGRIEEVVEA